MRIHARRAVKAVSDLVISWIGGEFPKRAVGTITDLVAPRLFDVLAGCCVRQSVWSDTCVVRYIIAPHYI